jgi:hypothetical protein
MPRKFRLRVLGVFSRDENSQSLPKILKIPFGNVFEDYNKDL